MMIPAVAYKTNGRDFSTCVTEADTGLASLSVRVCACCPLGEIAQELSSE